MAEQIKVLVADDSYQVRQSLKTMLEFDSEEFLVVGEAEDGEQALTETARLRPDVVLMDVKMPGMDGIEATARVMAQCPTAVVMISVDSDQELMRQVMNAGAYDYLVKPFTFDELVHALRNAAAARLELEPEPSAPPQRSAVPAKPPAAPRPSGTPKGPSAKGGKVITVFGTKGGVGKSTIVANLGVALARGGDRRVAVLDLDLEFGTLPTMMGVRPRSTLVDLCRLEGPIGPEQVEQVLVSVSQSGVGVLAGPAAPHLASEVDGDGRAQRNRNYAGEVIDTLRANHDWVIIDTAPSFRDANLAALDRSDLILMVTLPEVAVLEATAKGLDILIDQLEFPEEKVQVVLNRGDKTHGLSHPDIATSLGMTLAHLLPTDDEAAATAVNLGIPLVMKRANRSPLAEALVQMAADLAGEEAGATAPERKKPTGGVMRRLFGKR